MFLYAAAGAICLLSTFICSFQLFVLGAEADVEVSRIKNQMRDAGIQISVVASKMKAAGEELKKNPEKYKEIEKPKDEE